MRFSSVCSAEEGGQWVATQGRQRVDRRHHVGPHRLGDVAGHLGTDRRRGGQRSRQRFVPQGDLDLFEDGGGHHGVLDHRGAGDGEARTSSVANATAAEPSHRLRFVVSDGGHADALGEGGEELLGSQEEGDGAGSVHCLRPD